MICKKPINKFDESEATTGSHNFFVACLIIGAVLMLAAVLIAALK